MTLQSRLTPRIAGVSTAFAGCLVFMAVLTFQARLHAMPCCQEVDAAQEVCLSLCDDACDSDTECLMYCDQQCYEVHDATNCDWMCTEWEPPSWIAMLGWCRSAWVFGGAYPGWVCDPNP